MPKKSRPPVPQKVSIEYKGKTYTGIYTVEKGVITVSNSLYGSNATQVVGSPPEVLARITVEVNGTMCH